jgi:hypothetical protein
MFELVSGILLTATGWTEPGLFAAASGVADGLEGGSRQQQR